MQKKCKKCDKLFTPDYSTTEGTIYCAECRGTDNVSAQSEQPKPAEKYYSIREAREKFGVGKYKMAELLGIPATTYHTYEKKNYMPDNIFYKFAEIINIPYDQLDCDQPLPRGGKKKSQNTTELKMPKIKASDLTAVNKMMQKAGESIKQAFSNVAKNMQLPPAGENEYRYIEPSWLDAVAQCMTAGAKNHNGDWKDFPAKDHIARALRHVNLARMGDTSDNHLINASARLMMAYVIQTQTGKDGAAGCK